MAKLDRNIRNFLLSEGDAEIISLDEVKAVSDGPRLGMSFNGVMPANHRFRNADVWYEGGHDEIEAVFVSDVLTPCEEVRRRIVEVYGGGSELFARKLEEAAKTAGRIEIDGVSIIPGRYTYDRLILGS